MNLHFQNTSNKSDNMVSHREHLDEGGTQIPLPMKGFDSASTNLLRHTSFLSLSFISLYHTHFIDFRAI